MFGFSELNFREVPPTVKFTSRSAGASGQMLVAFMLETLYRGHNSLSVGGVPKVPQLVAQSHARVSDHQLLQEAGLEGAALLQDRSGESLRTHIRNLSENIHRLDWLEKHL